MLSTLESVLLGSKLRIAGVAVLLLGASVGGAFALGVLGAPTVTGVDNEFAGVDETQTTIQSDLRVRNPNPIGANLGGLTVDYAIDMNGIRMAEGTKSGVEVAQGNSTLPFTTYMANDRIPEWWVSHVSNGEQTTLTVDASIHSSTVGQSFGAPKVERSIETDMLSQFNSTETRPVNASQPLVSDPILYVNETSAQWGEVNESRTPLNLDFRVYNPKPYPVGVSEIGYEITMNDVPVGEGTTEQGYTVGPESAETVETTTLIDNTELDEWWVTHLERDQVTDLRIEFYARLEVTDGETIRVPLRSLTYTETIETDIFGNEAGGSGDAGGESGDDDSTATPRPTETPGDSTADGTATDAGSDTTTTDDGGLLDDTTTSEGTTTEGSETTSAPTPTDTPTNETSGTTTTDDGGLF
ncbi:LEA type 2 family protein [Salinirubrum litoreum]|uniref:LEA type 2 family protein n=1 Tax=Salinirubrum litoreum TaxID=1126234 RepID=A0ABD5RA38_9EURY|nr:LEA type 2 family protein [Salinirubrum litoreum]